MLDLNNPGMEKIVPKINGNKPDTAQVPINLMEIYLCGATNQAQPEYGTVTKKKGCVTKMAGLKEKAKPEEVNQGTRDDILTKGGQSGHI